MDWLTQNLDAYRIVAEVLTSMRTAVRERLEAAHGRDWYRSGVPTQVLDQLIASKEREQAIDWYDSEYQEIIDYAVFTDLLRIVEHDPETFGPIMALAPSPTLLHARFTELEVMRSKVGRARPLSDNELAYLTKFHQRVRKALDALTGSPLPEKKADAQARPEPQEDEDITIEVETEEAIAAGSRPRLRVGPRAVATAPPAPSGQQRRAPSQPPPVPALTEPEADATTTDDDPAVGAIDAALGDGDDLAVLRALYREVTVLAEELFASDRPAQPEVWTRVSVHPWFESNVSRLGLAPLTDFYHVLEEAHSRLDDGADKDELQAFLKERNFAKLLISLRDMFQKNKI